MSAPAFSAWLDQFLAAYYRRHPVNATFIGVHEHDHRLPDCSEQGLADSAAEMRRLLGSLRALPAESPTVAESMDRQMAEGFLEIALWELGSAHFERGNPSFYTGEAIFGILSLFLRPFAPYKQRAESAIARLQAVPALLRQGRDAVRAAPAAWTSRAIRECDGALAFLGSGLEQLAREQGGMDPLLGRAAAAAGAAFGDYRRYLERELTAHPSAGWAAGEEAFDLLLKRGHCLGRNAAEVEAYALDQLERSAAYLAEHAGDFGAADPAAALAGLADLHPRAGDYYARFEATWQAAKAAAVAADLVTWPEYPIRYVPQPLWARRAAPYLYFLPYRAPAPFDSVTPMEYLVPPVDGDLSAEEQERRLRAANDSVITLNHVVHHGGLGHHLQNYHAYRAESRLGRIAAVDCASRIAMFCGGTMAEGWACYATELMAETGFLSPLEQYSEQHSRLRMAARAIVDVRLHRGTIGIDEAAAFYRERVGMAEGAAHGEAVKNSMFPGAAMMYLSGVDMIHDLRRELSARRGSSFSLRRFHDRFLSYGSVPVALIAAAMREEDGHAQ